MANVYDVGMKYLVVWFHIPTKKYICQFKKSSRFNRGGDGAETVVVKLIRDTTQCGLKRAKNVVDGKLALIRADDVLDFVDLHCEVGQGTTMSAVPQLGFEYAVVWTRVAERGPEPTGYVFVVHCEA
tara:strand:+ start:108 stop:488 length:381 start_codon:yes stop_codon:yes gene_type:complete